MVANNVFQKVANRKNAQLSTGPKTEEGKAKSRLNARTHGLTARILPEGDDPVALDEARDRWIGCLNPQNDIALALAEASFDAKVRLDNVRRADDAAIAMRVREAKAEYLQQLYDATTVNFDVYQADPFHQLDQYKRTRDGSFDLIMICDGLHRKLNEDRWERPEITSMLKLEGRKRDEYDADLETFVNMCDCKRRYESVIQSAKYSNDDNAAELIRIARSDMKVIEPEFNRVRAAIARRIASNREEFVVFNVEANASIEIESHLRMEMARYDGSPEGRNRQRYLRDTWRDFSKSTADAIAACGPPPEEHEDAAPTAQITSDPPPPPNPEPHPEPAAVARNEAKSLCEDLNDCPPLRLVSAVDPTPDDAPDPA